MHRSRTRPPRPRRAAAPLTHRTHTDSDQCDGVPAALRCWLAAAGALPSDGCVGHTVLHVVLTEFEGGELWDGQEALFERLAQLRPVLTRARSTPAQHQTAARNCNILKIWMHIMRVFQVQRRSGQVVGISRRKCCVRCGSNRDPGGKSQCGRSTTGSRAARPTGPMRRSPLSSPQSRSLRAVTGDKAESRRNARIKFNLIYG